MIVSFSGGADSTALAWYLKDKGEEIELVMADTGAELPETLFAAPDIARRLGVKLTVLSSATFFQRLTARGFLLPSFKIRWCSRELKIDCLPKDTAIGITADEAHRRPEAYRPLVDAGITKEEARAICKKHGLLNPCYRWRSSCSCFCCPFQGKFNWLGLLQQHHQLYALAELWEGFSMQTGHGFTWNEKFSLKQLREADEQQVKLFRDSEHEACAICLA